MRAPQPAAFALGADHRGALVTANEQVMSKCKAIGYEPFDLDGASGDTTLCKVTPTILHGIVSPGISSARAEPFCQSPHRHISKPASGLGDSCETDASRHELRLAQRSYMSLSGYDGIVCGSAIKSRLGYPEERAYSKAVDLTR